MKYSVTLLLSFFFLFSAFKSDKPSITIFMIVDSNITNEPLANKSTEREWWQVLPNYLSKEISIDNCVLKGCSSKRFIDEGHWDNILSLIKKGDYIFIQLESNNEKSDSICYTKPENSLDANLRRFINKTRDKGGIPVLFGSGTHRDLSENLYIRKLEETVAKELKVPFVDINKIKQNLSDGLYVEITGLLPELAKYIQRYDFVVAKDGSGDFCTVQDAINAVPDFRKSTRTTILVKKGVYKEKLIVPESKINVSLLGQEGAVLTYDDYASKPNYFGEDQGTSGSSSCYIYAPDFYAENITFENSSGLVGQAVACFISADRVYFKKCSFLGFQDTLYTYGKASRQYYEDCYIEGSVDFIFGWSTAVFNRCRIHSKTNGYVTAPSTDAGQQYGYIFYNCKLTADDGVDQVYLSRPWRPYAQAVFIHCDLGKHIVPVGWNNWDKKENEKTVFYAEYENTGEGANPKARASFSHQLKNLNDYKIDKVLAGNDAWAPVINGNELLDIKR